MFEWLPRITTGSKLDKLVRNAVKERMGEMHERFPIFQEGNAEEIISKMASGDIWEKKKHSRKLVEYMTERKRTGLRRSTTGGYTMVRTEFKYDRIESFFNKESYFSRSVIRQIETMLRNGIEFVSDDRKAVSLINREITRLQMDSGMPLEQLFWRWIKEVQTKGVLVVHKMRKRLEDKFSTNTDRIQRLFRLRVMDPSKTIIYLDREGSILSAAEYGSGFVASSAMMDARNNASKNSPPGILHKDLAVATIYDAGETIFPTPPCYQMLDDILTLRSIEETVELLCFQFGSPLLHAKVGTTEEPASADEVIGVNNQIVAMAPNGMITTDHRVTLDVVNIQKAFTNLMPFIEHFTKRVIIGSGTSPVSVGMGETANRATSESIDDALADHCSYLGKVVCNVFNHNIIPDLLLTAGYDPMKLFDSDGDLLVQMRFNEMRIEKQVAHENSVINKWNNNLISLPEARKKLSEKPISKTEEKELQVHKVQIPLAKAKASMVGTGGAAAATKNKSQPTNQHGQKAGPGSRKN